MFVFQFVKKQKLRRLKTQKIGNCKPQKRSADDLSTHPPPQHKEKQRGVSHYGLAINIKKYLKAKEEE
jgi:hypothetical protein